MALSSFADLNGETILDDERVSVARYVVKPGHSTGRHIAAHHQLLIFIYGGVLTAANGRATIWADGRVEWLTGGAPSRFEGVNTGGTDIVFVGVTLQPVEIARDAVSGPPVEPLSYPNVPGEDLVDNEWVIVQRFRVGPGQWEGVHAHHANMLFVHLRGGHWGERSYRQPFRAYPEPTPDGSVGWIEPVGIDVGHESRNIGRAPIDVVWVSLKR